MTSVTDAPLSPLAAQAATALQTGDAAKTEALCRQGLQAEPDAVWPAHFLALLAYSTGDTDAAINQLHDLSKKRRKDASIWSDLGSLLMAKGDLAQAEQALRNAALYAAPTFAGAYYNLGNLLRLRGSLTEAEEAYGQALARQPNHAGSLHNLALTLLDRGRAQAALPLAQAARAVATDKAEALFLEGNILRTLGHSMAALGCYDKAIALAPQSGPYHTNRGNLLTEQGRAVEAIGAYQNAVEARPYDARYASNLLCSLQYADGVTPEILLTAHQGWDARHGCPEPRPRPQRAPRADSDPLTIGLLSADFGTHPVGWFTLPLVEGADPQDLRIILYSDRKAEDEITARLAAGAAKFWRVVEADDDTLAAQIAADGVDILVDMSGHTGGNRLGLFANRAAPLQASWAAYVGTTGIAAMDFLIADQQQIPTDDEAFYSEQIIRLPVGYVPYAPPPYAPACGPLPDPTQGVVLGSFNNPAKLSDSCLRLWAQTLAAIPQARLLIKFRYLDDPPTAQHLYNRFVALGGDGARLDIEGGCSHADLLAAYGRVHVALDTSPYSGGLTTLEALWMGVPVLTMPGKTFASRHSLSHLSHLGLHELCANDADDFIAKARKLATDGERLAHYRNTLRPRMAQGSVCDGKAFARHLSRALRQVWSQSPEGEGKAL